jgi:hypothetical protein
MSSYHYSAAAIARSKDSIADINKQVIEYLVKKGYNRTEQTLRQESSNLDKDGKYTKAFQLLSNWVDSNLDIYKVSPPQYLDITGWH